MSDPKKTSKKHAPKKSDFFPGIPIPRENPFHVMVQLFHQSIGKLPAHLVIIFVIAAVIAVLCGAMLRVMEPSTESKVFLAQTLKAQPDKPALNEVTLHGTWVHQGDGQIVTIEMANGVFEMVLRYSKAPNIRYYAGGGYRVEGNVLILQQREDIGAPPNTPFEIKYFPLTLRRINLYAENNGKIMSWTIPASEKSKQNSTGKAFFDKSDAPMDWIKIGATP